MQVRGRDLLCKRVASLLCKRGGGGMGYEPELNDPVFYEDDEEELDEEFDTLEEKDGESNE